ncbi:MAG TPA: hypothetical protein VHG10_09155, partial [Glycomyces sp.]|nr:hypothetical protein [Glycomyces sp.]
MVHVSLRQNRLDATDQNTFERRAAGPGDPRSEPPHLRHQPGDTWEIGGRPDDPLDPGPSGTPGWCQDRRTGRHRRGELPDPLPPEAEKPSPSPRHHRRFWPEPDPHNEEPYRFSKLREDAWDRWLIDSAPLAAAHTQRTARRHGRTVTALLRVFRWTAALLFGTMTSAPRL